MKTIIIIMTIITISIPLIQAAHYIVGYVEDALDSEPANGKAVTLWNPLNGVSDNQTDTVGPTGNSGTDNIFMIDCELLSTPCIVNDIISVKIFNSGNNYISQTVNVTVTGAGFDLTDNLTINSPIEIESVEVEDNLALPLNEIDLTPATSKNISCVGILRDFDTEDEILSANATFFHSSASFSDSNDNNTHYTNSSCEIDKSYGSNKQAKATCNMSIQYYANSGSWNCTIIAVENNSLSSIKGDLTNINTLLAIGVDSPIDFGLINSTAVSDELKVNITNYGNIKINLTLNGYAKTENDGYAMNCSEGHAEYIPINYEKYNLSSSTSGTLTLSEFEDTHTNLTTTPTVREFNLNFRQSDTINDAKNETYWRIYVPEGIAGTCSGNTIFGAVQAPEV